MSTVKTQPKINELATHVAEATSTGLCITCRNEPSCMYPRNSVEAVHQCEEFQAFEFPFWMEKGIDPTTEERLSAPQASVTTSRSVLKGLCQTCALAESCTYPKHEAGVWHCEEFE